MLLTFFQFCALERHLSHICLNCCGIRARKGPPLSLSFIIPWTLCLYSYICYSSIARYLFQRWTATLPPPAPRSTPRHLKAFHNVFLCKTTLHNVAQHDTVPGHRAYTENAYRPHAGLSERRRFDYTIKIFGIPSEPAKSGRDGDAAEELSKKAVGLENASRLCSSGHGWSPPCSSLPGASTHRLHMKYDVAERGLELEGDRTWNLGVSWLHLVSLEGKRRCHLLVPVPEWIFMRSI
uniref:Secreted protein n=2 Tax=Steinernema glaseri TaxID=37863 RepID=A0A1I7YAL8_9BILA